MKRTIALLPSILLLLAGCVSPGAVTTSPTPATSASASDSLPSTQPTEQPSASALPIDTSITPVSASNPTPDAKAVLDACFINQIGTDRVAGMGLLAHGSDAYHYARFTGREPELKSSAPVWLVILSGKIPMPQNGETWVDPTCVSANGEAGFFATGPVIVDKTGTELPAPNVPVLPDRALPPLAP